MKRYYFTNEVSDKLRSVKDLPDFVLHYPKFADQIKILRETLGLTQKQLAQKIGSTARSIIRIEQGTMLPNVATLEKIAEVLNAKLNILFVPQKELTELLNEKAEQKAQQLVGLAKGNSALEAQSPSAKAYRAEVEKTKKHLLEKKRGLLWEK